MLTELARMMSAKLDFQVQFSTFILSLEMKSLAILEPMDRDQPRKDQRSWSQTFQALNRETTLEDCFGLELVATSSIPQ